MIPARGKEVWKRHPYAGLLFCSVIAGIFWFALVDALLRGYFRSGRGSGATIINRASEPVQFWLGICGLGVVGTFVLTLGIVKFARAMRRARYV